MTLASALVPQNGERASSHLACGVRRSGDLAGARCDPAVSCSVRRAGAGRSHRRLLPDAMSAVLPPADPGPDFFSVENLVPAALRFGLAGVCLIALRGLVAAFGLRALRRQSMAHDFGDLPEIEPRCELRISTADESCGPVTWGFLRPVDPASEEFRFLAARHASKPCCCTRHAHIRRHDSLAQMLSLFVCALYWPNPLVWLGARAMRREAEMAADDAVIVAGVKPSAYAGELLQLASEFLARGPSTATALFMAAPSALEARVQSVLAPTQQRSGVTKMDVLKIACAGVSGHLRTCAGASLAGAGCAASRRGFVCRSNAIGAGCRRDAAGASRAGSNGHPPTPPAPASEARAADSGRDAMSSDADANVQVREELAHGQWRADEARAHDRDQGEAPGSRSHRQGEARDRKSDRRGEGQRTCVARAMKDAQPQIDEAMKTSGRRSTRLGRGARGTRESKSRREDPRARGRAH
jgi:hypothetical protein